MEERINKIKDRLEGTPFYLASQDGGKCTLMTGELVAFVSDLDTLEKTSKDIQRYWNGRKS